MKLRDRLPEASEGPAAIEKDHQHSAAKIAALKSAVDKVLKDVNVPRNTFVSAAMDFIQFQRELALD